MAIVILDPAQVLLFLATGAFPARWGKNTCAEQVVGSGWRCGGAPKRGQTGKVVSYLECKEKKNTWSECNENNGLGTQQREKLVKLPKKLCPFASCVLGESARVNRVTAK